MCIYSFFPYTLGGREVWLHEIVKKLPKEKYDVYIQFVQSYGGVDGDSASIAIAIAIISALKKIPVKQNYCMTGSLSIRGNILPVGGINAKIEGAIESGMEYIMLPKSNMNDIVLNQEIIKKIKIIPIEFLSQALANILNWLGNEPILEAIMKLQN